MSEATDQLGLFDAVEGRRLRDEAVERVNDPLWRSFAMDALHDIAQYRQTVTSEDVWRVLALKGIPFPREHRAMGPIMQAGVREGWIETRGFVQAERSSRHAAPIRVYQSKITR
jgi:hypothetical protein